MPRLVTLIFTKDVYANHDRIQLHSTDGKLIYDSQTLIFQENNL